MDHDPTFDVNAAGLQLALKMLADRPEEAGALPSALPDVGLGEIATLRRLAPLVLGGARRLGSDTSFAHMDPPTPWITWAMALWNASLNQNLLHPDVAPAARDIEAQVIGWLAPCFGMDGGHMTPGSTISNLTALWAARELCGIRRIVASAAAHLSIAKSAHLLGLEHVAVPVDDRGCLKAAGLPDNLDDAALVLTAGTTNNGAIDALALAGRATWTHVDAAWAGPMMFSPRYANRLNGIEAAQSVAVSAHKWLFQPKESGLLFFNDSLVAHRAVSFGGDYLAAPNVGVLGSHGAVAVPLLATLLAWGRQGLARRIDQAMALAEGLAQYLAEREDVEMFPGVNNGVLLWRSPYGPSPDDILRGLPPGTASKTTIAGRVWVRQVAANPNMKLNELCLQIDQVLRRLEC